MKIVVNFLVLLLHRVVQGSSCGDSAIPYSLEILPDGQPILGCARPSCFGWSPSGRPATLSGNFYNINRRPDGYLRESQLRIQPFSPNDPRYFKPQTAVCESSFLSPTCRGDTEWVGGIAPLLNVTEAPLTLQCCAYDILSQAEDRGIAIVNSGQIVVGGEVFTDGLQYAFDYIANIQKSLMSRGVVSYEVTIRRFPCAPLPDALPKEAPSKILKPPSSARYSPQRYRAYQADMINVDNPLPPPTEDFANQLDQNGVIEEIVREEAFQLPNGQLVQGQDLSAAAQRQPLQTLASQDGQFYNDIQYQNGGGNDMLCFSGDMMVNLIDGKQKKMDQLQKMDWVGSMSNDSLNYSPITFWVHRVPQQLAIFHQFVLADKKTIKITSHHYIFKGDCSHEGREMVPFDKVNKEAVRAESIQIGDCLYSLNPEGNAFREVRVISSGVVEERGIYAPMTASGKLIVNGVYCSCHSFIHSHSIQHTFFTYVRKAFDWYLRLRGVEENGEVTEIPFGMSAILQLLEVALPPHLSTS